MNSDIMKEKMDTPQRRPIAIKSLSPSLLGLKSPNPTVVRDVNEK